MRNVEGNWGLSGGVEMIVEWMLQEMNGQKVIFILEQQIIELIFLCCK